MGEATRKEDKADMIQMIKESCGGSDNRSSKRIIMYLFSFIAMAMIATQALFTFLAMWNWFMNDKQFEVLIVFPDTIWYMVFGLIGGLAGVNGLVTGVKNYSNGKNGNGMNEHHDEPQV